MQFRAVRMILLEDQIKDISYVLHNITYQLQRVPNQEPS